MPVHQLATHDLLAAYLRVGNPTISEGLVAWVPERAGGQLFRGLLRPNALACVRVGDHLATLCIERDLGTERGERLADKIRRYASLLARAPAARVRVAFVVESDRRARSILDVARRRGAGNARFVTRMDGVAPAPERLALLADPARLMAEVVGAGLDALMASAGLLADFVRGYARPPEAAPHPDRQTAPRSSWADQPRGYRSATCCWSPCR